MGNRDGALSMLRLPDPDRLCWRERLSRFVWWNAVRADTAREIGCEFPPTDDPRWHTFTGDLEQGKQEGRADIAGAYVRAMHDELAGDWFVDWLRALTGEPDLVADPDRIGGGIHQSGPGARLAMHVDFRVHPMRPELVRAVNVILFVSDCTSWNPGWGGEFHWGDSGRIGPSAGEFVVFEANETSYHGHPVPMADDAPVLRRSVPSYYYRPLRDGEQVEAHSTRFLDQ